MKGKVVCALICFLHLLAYIEYPHTRQKIHPNYFSSIGYLPRQAVSHAFPNIERSFSHNVVWWPADVTLATSFSIFYISGYLSENVKASIERTYKAKTYHPSMCANILYLCIYRKAIIFPVLPTNVSVLAAIYNSDCQSYLLTCFYRYRNVLF